MDFLKNYSMPNNKFSKVFLAIILILLVWIIHILVLPHILQFGMQGDDWGWLFYYDTHKASQLSTFLPFYKNDLGSLHPLQQLYYIGTLRNIFGLNQTAFQLTTLFFKSLAALSAGYLVYKLTKGKLFAFLVILFFIIFPSTAGLFVIVTGLNYLLVVFMCFSIYFYIQSVKDNRYILLASLFFFLALSTGAARAYLLVPIPFIVELVRLGRKFRPFVFIQRLLIFYFLPFIFLKGNGTQYQLNPMVGVFTRIRQITDGNLYTFSLPFQMVSTLFVDQSILKGMSNLLGFIIVNLILFFLSIFLGFVIFSREKMKFFVTKIMFSTIVLEIIFYILALIHSNSERIPFVDVEGNVYFELDLNPTIFLASIGGYIFTLGILLILEWWKNQRDNKILMIAVFAWIWSVISILILYLTSPWMLMIKLSNDRYIFSSSPGAVIFTAAIFTLSLKALEKIKNLKFRLLCFSIVGAIILLIVWKDYRMLDQLHYAFIRQSGGVSSYWENTMHRRFLDKFGRENLRKPALVFINDSPDVNFNEASFVRQITHRIYYDENNNLIRDNCKAVTTNIKDLEKAYTVYNGEKGFSYDYTVCVNRDISVGGEYNIFYPLTNFYAYRMENKEFIDIKDEIIGQLDEKKK